MILVFKVHSMGSGFSENDDKHIQFDFSHGSVIDDKHIQSDSSYSYLS